MIIVLGAAPLVVGVIIAGLYWLTQWSGLVMAGMLTILGGMVCVLVSLVMLWMYSRKKPWEGRVWLALLLLGSNFPAAVMCMSVAFDVGTRLNITVVNKGTTTVKSCVLGTNVKTRELGPIGPGASVSYSMTNPNGGTLWITRSSSTGSTTTTLLPHVDSDVHDSWTVTLDGDATTMR
jgi:hypothetical protein